MVSELLQDRPRLVKQMGSIIFILVYKWIFKFPLGYLKYYQRSTHNTHPAKTKFHESFCPRKVLSFLCFLLMLLGTVAKPSEFRKDGLRLHTPGSPAGMAQGCTALEAPLEGSPALPRRAVAFAGPWWPCRALSNAERAAAAAATREPQDSCECIFSSLLLQQILSP